MQSESRPRLQKQHTKGCRRYEDGSHYHSNPCKPEFKKPQERTKISHIKD